MAFTFSVFIPIIVIALIVLLVVGVRTNKEDNNGGEEMIKSVYIYLVLFATLMMVIGGSVAAFMAVADIVAPNAYYQSFEDYKNWGPHVKPVSPDDTRVEPVLSDEEIRERYDAMVASEKERNVSRAYNNLIKSFGWIVIPLPVFVFFQRRLLKKVDTQ